MPHVFSPPQGDASNHVPLLPTPQGGLVSKAYADLDAASIAWMALRLRQVAMHEASRAQPGGRGEGEGAGGIAFH